MFLGTGNCHDAIARRSLLWSPATRSPTWTNPNSRQSARTAAFFRRLEKHSPRSRIHGLAESFGRQRSFHSLSARGELDRVRQNLDFVSRDDRAETTQFSDGGWRTATPSTPSPASLDASPIFGSCLVIIAVRHGCRQAAAPRKKVRHRSTRDTRRRTSPATCSNRKLRRCLVSPRRRPPVRRCGGPCGASPESNFG